MPGAIAWSATMSLGNQEATRSTLASGTFFGEDLVMNLFYGNSSSSADFKKSSCQLMAKECTLSTGKLLRGGLSRISVDRITDRSNMTLAIDRACKPLTQPT